MFMLPESTFWTIVYVIRGNDHVVGYDLHARFENRSSESDPRASICKSSARRLGRELPSKPASFRDFKDAVYPSFQSDTLFLEGFVCCC